MVTKEKIMNEKMYLISEKFRDTLGRYLVTRPYMEVFELINELNRIPQAIMKEESKEVKNENNV